MSIDLLKQSIRSIENFPKPGVSFADITPLLSNPQQLKELQSLIGAHYANCNITKVVGLESRGFFFAPAIAMGIGAGFVPARKPGKLPFQTIGIEYEKEYGRDKIEIHVDARNENDVVLIHDDVLATGGTINAAIELVKKCNVKKIYVNFIVEITALQGRDKIQQGVDVMSLIKL